MAWPTEEAEHAWYRMERERLRREEERILEMQRGRQEDRADPMMPKQITRTTAEPRPNAYIPDELGIPRPYGSMAPFKPTEAGSTMRHIRPERPREIEV